MRASHARPGSLPFACDFVEWSEVSKHGGDITETPHGNPDAWAWRHVPRAEAPTVIAVDVGKQAAISIIRGGPSPHVAVFPLAFEAFDLEASRALREVFRRCLGLCPDGDARPPLVVVEDVFLHAGAPNVKSTLALARKVGAIIGYVSGCAVEAPIVRVLATRWQAAIIGRKLTRAEGKRASIETASRLFPGVEIGSDHEAEALLIALYARGGRR